MAPISAKQYAVCLPTLAVNEAVCLSVWAQPECPSGVEAHGLAYGVFKLEFLKYVTGLLYCYVMRINSSTGVELHVREGSFQFLFGTLVSQRDQIIA
jgi:hypothetical protein